MTLASIDNIKLTQAFPEKYPKNTSEENSLNAEDGFVVINNNKMIKNH